MLMVFNTLFYRYSSDDFYGAIGFIFIELP